MKNKKIKEKCNPEPARLWYDKNRYPHLLEILDPEDLSEELELQIEKLERFEFISDINKGLDVNETIRLERKLVEVFPHLEFIRRKTGDYIHRKELLKFIEKEFWDEESFTVKDLYLRLPSRILEKLYSSYSDIPWRKENKNHLRKRLNRLANNGWLMKERIDGENHYQKSDKFVQFLNNNSFDDLV